MTLAQLRLLDGVAAATGRAIEAVLFDHPRQTSLPDSTYHGNHVTVAEVHRLTAADLTRGCRALRAAFRRCDLLIDIGEGDSFTDVYGGRRYLKQMASKVLALSSGRPLVLAPQTIGPFGGGLRECPASHVLARATAVFARDRDSADYARALSRRSVIEATDLAFALPYERPRAQRGGRTPRLGLNVSGLLFAERATRRKFGLAVCYPALIEALIAAFRDGPGCEIVLVGHVLGPPGSSDQDTAVTEQLAARHPGIGIAPSFADPRDAKSFIAGLDFFIGARMHACIAAYSSGIPLLPLAYTRKATGLFRSLGYELVGELRADPEGVIVEQALGAFARRDELRATLDVGNRLARQRLGLYTDALCELIGALP